MSADSVFGQLTRSLSPDEREVLLERIQNSLNLKPGSSSSIVRKSEDDLQRRKRIQADMVRSGLGTQFKLWLTSLFSTRTAEERFTQLKTQQQLRYIRQIDRDLIDDTGEYIGAALARQVAGLSRQAAKLKPFFEETWADEQQVAGFASELAAEHIPGARKHLFDFITREQLAAEFQRKKQGDASLPTIKNAIKSYLADVHPGIYEQVAEELAPLYYLREAVQFPYENFLGYFRGKEGFHGARFQTIREMLEELYSAAYIATRWKEKSRVSAVITGGSDKTAQQIHDFSRSVSDFFLGIPLAEIIKVGCMDPYYRFMIYVPRIDIRRFLRAYLHLQLMQEYDAVIHEIQIEVLRTQIVRLIDDSWRNPLRYMLPYQFSDSQGLGLPVLRRVYSLGLYYHYVKYLFGRRHESYALMISRAQTRRIRQTSSDMLIVLSNIDDIADRIERLNHSLSPESSDGEEIRRLRATLRHDAGLQRQYRAQLSQMDRVAQELSNRATENLISLRDQFVSFAKRLSEDRQNTRHALETEADWLTGFIDGLQLIAAVEDENPDQVAQGLRTLNS
ncbi:DUF5312 family protein [Spirochaeta africana]|uniref:Uncharacterized protein n=1 Tax=Spirochaeta africana (strain ATCC 700263 / DSM 8902 / Z-7692) TaxID=889378 RepID=H9UJ57_SPIAZ|nr:DUF5312 family protein [Spirochaeta africana]AFG37550.1 hypothetical protein Spiaf_1489 [Spirochaeta africana DSM 8902]